MTAYRVTASNEFFWQDLLVEADNDKAAWDAVEAYLELPEQIEAEEYEFNQSMAIADDETGWPDRTDYKYTPQLIAEYYGSHDATITVKLIDSGGNG
jgi:hypothetical protein